MNLNEYFEPVSLDKPELTLLEPGESFSKSVKIHTPGHPVKYPSPYNIAIFGIPDERESLAEGMAGAPDEIRKQLYGLAPVNRNLKIADFGNLRLGDKKKDTLFAIRDIMLELRDNNTTAIVLATGQDLLLGALKTLEKSRELEQVCILDSRIDLNETAGEPNPLNFLRFALKDKNLETLHITVLGNQIYYTPQKLLDKFEDKGHNFIRLAKVRDNLSIAEHILRDARILSVDMSSLRSSDAPGVKLAGPNGFFGHEFCRLTRYAGSSPRLESIIYSEYSPLHDDTRQTAALIAQSVWYFIEGYAIRHPEDPKGKGFKKFIVSSGAGKQNMVFYKSNATDRWWVELPVNEAPENHPVIACSYEDYQKACVNEIPDRWWKIMKHFG